MLVRLRKAPSNDRRHSLTILRDDGSTTGMPSTEFFVRHDLTHFAVESVLGLRQAFYGLIEQGWEIGSFEEREPGTRKSRTLPPEAHLAEVLVGSFDLEVTAGPLSAEDRLSHLTAAGVGPLPSPHQLEAIRHRKSELLRAWTALPPGETLELQFPKEG